MKTKDRAYTSGGLALDKKAKDVLVLELTGLTDLTDFFVLANGTSERHVRTVAENIELGMKEKGVSVLSAEGYNDGRWIILDYGDVIVHVFLESLRELYDLENLYLEAKREALAES